MSHLEIPAALCPLAAVLVLLAASEAAAVTDARLHVKRGTGM